MAKNFQKLTDNKTKILEAQRTRGKIIPKKQTNDGKTPRHIIFTLLKNEDEEKILKVVRGKSSL